MRKTMKTLWHDGQCAELVTTQNISLEHYLITNLLSF
jgi:hypothetical protein